ncbi:MAG TPA: DUF3500 domain-containing protein, partial [Thermoanaerobaculia bacterium]
KSASRVTLAVSLLLAASLLLAGCGGGEQGSGAGQGSEEEQGSQEKTTTAAQPETTGGGGSTTVAAATQGGGDATAQVVAATEAFLATLNDAQREQASFAFDDELKRLNWSNLPVPVVPRNGVALDDMTEEQQQAAMAVLQAALSEEGYQKTVGIMVADQALANEVDGGELRFGIDRYLVTIFGTPSETEPWMLQFGGHHLGLNLTVSGEDNVLTPSFTGVQPSEYTLDQAGDLTAFEPAGVLPAGTVRPMADENDLAFELINALEGQQQEEAILDYEVSDLVLGADQDVRVLEPEGISASEMTANQRAQLLILVREWAGIANELAAEERMSEIEANLDQTYFAWSGPTTNGESVYYRITGPTLHIEFAYAQAPLPGGYLHIHSVYRDPTNDYGEQTIAG